LKPKSLTILLQVCLQIQVAALHVGETFGTLIALLFAQAAVKGLKEEFMEPHDAPVVGCCRSTVTKPVLKAPMVAALEATIR
jgi:hypothetical protein